MLYWIISSTSKSSLTKEEQNRSIDNEEIIVTSNVYTEASILPFLLGKKDHLETQNQSNEQLKKERIESNLSTYFFYEKDNYLEKICKEKEDYIQYVLNYEKNGNAEKQYIIISSEEARAYKRNYTIFCFRIIPQQIYDYQKQIDKIKNLQCNIIEHNQNQLSYTRSSIIQDTITLNELYAKQKQIYNSLREELFTLENFNKKYVNRTISRTFYNKIYNLSDIKRKQLETEYDKQMKYLTETLYSKDGYIGDQNNFNETDNWDEKFNNADFIKEQYTIQKSIDNDKILAQTSQPTHHDHSPSIYDCKPQENLEENPITPDYMEDKSQLEKVISNEYDIGDQNNFNETENWDEKFKNPDFIKEQYAIQKTINNEKILAQTSQATQHDHSPSIYDCKPQEVQPQNLDNVQQEGQPEKIDDEPHIPDTETVYDDIYKIFNDHRNKTTEILNIDSPHENIIKELKLEEENIINKILDLEKELSQLDDIEILENSPIEKYKEEVIEQLKVLDQKNYKIVEMPEIIKHLINQEKNHNILAEKQKHNDYIRDIKKKKNYNTLDIDCHIKSDCSCPYISKSDLIDFKDLNNIHYSYIDKSDISILNSSIYKEEILNKTKQNDNNKKAVPFYAASDLDFESYEVSPLNRSCPHIIDYDIDSSSVSARSYIQKPIVTKPHIKQPIVVHKHSSSSKSEDVSAINLNTTNSHKSHNCLNYKQTQNIEHQAQVSKKYKTEHDNKNTTQAPSENKYLKEIIESIQLTTYSDDEYLQEKIEPIQLTTYRDTDWSNKSKVNQFDLDKIDLEFHINYIHQMINNDKYDNGKMFKYDNGKIVKYNNDDKCNNVKMFKYEIKYFIEEKNNPFVKVDYYANKLIASINSVSMDKLTLSQLAEKREQIEKAMLDKYHLVLLALNKLIEQNTHVLYAILFLQINYIAKSIKWEMFRDKIEQDDLLDKKQKIKSFFQRYLKYYNNYQTAKMVVDDRYNPLPDVFQLEEFYDNNIDLEMFGYLLEKESIEIMNEIMDIMECVLKLQKTFFLDKNIYEIKTDNKIKISNLLCLYYLSDLNNNYDNFKGSYDDLKKQQKHKLSSEKETYQDLINCKQKLINEYSKMEKKIKNKLTKSVIYNNTLKTQFQEECNQINNKRSKSVDSKAKPSDPQEKPVDSSSDNSPIRTDSDYEDGHNFNVVDEGIENLDINNKENQDDHSSNTYEDVGSQEAEEMS